MTIERVGPSVIRARVGKATVSLSIPTGQIVARAPGGAITDLRAALNELAVAEHLR
ncbi:hypothetical protein MINS_12640 [Mycolicibacterium insubricum]|uniref:hypothetical protein n=1 Tax=Mycolicibacterium insubricum TaxID=444597 RepID=UPI00138C049E|nr:hypothetical protein [Mycolicibacterium insubricum]MCV7081280.1 hypothetical protein [Mycolicibacterium insubricum]BBZ65835.1 hypothetical protein MINS_12640 [Mycolicibacterium insubricum]